MKNYAVLSLKFNKISNSLLFLLRRLFVRGGDAVFPDERADFVAGALGGTEHAVQGAQMFQGFRGIQAAHFGVQHPENETAHVEPLVHDLYPLHILAQEHSYIQQIFVSFVHFGLSNVQVFAFLVC